jgi:hypothetical protein
MRQFRGGWCEIINRPYITEFCPHRIAVRMTENTCTLACISVENRISEIENHCKLHRLVKKMSAYRHSFLITSLGILGNHDI